MENFKDDLIFPVRNDYALPSFIHNPFNKDKVYNYGVICEMDGTFLNHYFHDMEWLLGLYAWSKYRFANQPVEAVVHSKKNKSKILHQILKTLFPKADFIQKNRFSHKTNLKLGCSSLIKNAISTDRFYKLSNKGPDINKMLCQSIDISKKYFPEFLQSIYNSLSITPKKAPHKREDIVVTYIMRKAPRYLEKREELFDILESEFQVKVNPVYFEKLTFEEQVQTVANTDILIGVHGNGLTNLLWLPEHGSAIELFPKKCHHYDYQVFCEISDRYYFGFNSDDEESYVFHKGTRHKDFYGDPNTTIKNLNLDIFKEEFSKLLSEHLKVL